MKESPSIIRLFLTLFGVSYLNPVSCSNHILFQFYITNGSDEAKEVFFSSVIVLHFLRSVLAWLFNHTMYKIQFSDHLYK